MALHTLNKERLDNLININVSSHGCMDYWFRCDLKFDITHVFNDGFKPDSDWYWADLNITELTNCKNRGVIVTFSDTCEDAKQMINDKINKISI
jgi:hypothetical protein